MTTEFWGEVAKAQTLRDGGIRITFDLPETAIVEMAELAAYQIHGVVVDVVVTPRKTGQEQVNCKERNDLETGSKRKSEW